MDSVNLKLNLNKTIYTTFYETTKGNQNLKPLFWQTNTIIINLFKFIGARDHVLFLMKGDFLKF